MTDLDTTNGQHDTPTPEPPTFDGKAEGRLAIALNNLISADMTGPAKVDAITLLRDQLPGYRKMTAKNAGPNVVSTEHLKAIDTLAHYVATKTKGQRPDLVMRWVNANLPIAAACNTTVADMLIDGALAHHGAVVAAKHKKADSTGGVNTPDR